MTTSVGEREPVRLTGVGRRYGPRGPWVLRGVDLELPPGRLVRAVGPNGTGKSTLLRLVAGVDAPAEGRITGRPPRTAYVPERFPPALPFTAHGYLVHLARLQGLRTGPARVRAGEWLERFGAGEYAGTALAGLSKGTAQKVAVAQALLAEPGLLVLDEAWTGLDTGARAALDDAVRERVAAGATVLFVDHDPRRLAGEAHPTLRVENGHVRPEPPPSFVPVRVAAGGLSLPGEAMPTPDGGGTLPGGDGADSASVRVVGSGVVPLPDVVPGGGVSAAAGGGSLPGGDGADSAAVRVVASGGLSLPDPLPGGATSAVTGGGTLFRVGAAASDELLRVLLAASWHVHRVEPETAPVPAVPREAP
ncbi:ABC transporter ATP-binding protein [Streptomyces hydrogenans]|uniref:ABC transporter ATP-binding protein n=1 Tax=Streptomyces hydrogenans TaxID=1873719 RepID=UPI0034322FDD